MCSLENVSQEVVDELILQRTEDLGTLQVQPGQKVELWKAYIQMNRQKDIGRSELLTYAFSSGELNKRPRGHIAHLSHIG
jgi:hypothetical protein